MIPLLLTLTAFAQDVDPAQLDAQHFRPSVDGQRLLWTDTSRRVGDHAMSVGAVASYARLPWVYVPAGQQEVVGVVTDVFQTDILATWGWGPVRVGVDLPIHLYANGEAGRGAGLGDLALDVKGTLLDPEHFAVGVAAGSRLSLPTSVGPLALGERSVSWEGEAIVDAHLGDHLVALNVGVRIRPRNDLGDVVLDDQFVARLAGAWTLGPGGGLSAEMATRLNTGDLITNPAGLVVEGLIGGWVHTGLGSRLNLGLGTGFSRGIGAPVARAVVGWTWGTDGVERSPRPDARTDAGELALPEPPEEPVANAAWDDVMAALAAAPATEPEPPIAPPAPIDTDGDGFPDDADACPQLEEDPDGIQDDDGCPEGAVSVRVVAPGGDPIPNAEVSIAGTPLPAQPDGTWQAIVGGGFWTIDVSAPGYLDGELEMVVETSEEAAAVLELVPVERSGNVRLVVEDVFGDPIPTARFAVDGWDLLAVPVDAFEASPGRHALLIEAEGYRTIVRDLVVPDKGATGIRVVMMKDD